jgi:hypothetical protein
MCLLNGFKYEDVFNFIKFIYTGKIIVKFGSLMKFVASMETDFKLEMQNISIDVLPKIDDSKKLQKKQSEGQKRKREDNDEESVEVVEKVAKIADSSAGPSCSKVNTSPVERKPLVSLDNVKMNAPKRRKSRKTYDDDFIEYCTYCDSGFHNRNTFKTHERFCYANPNRVQSICNFCLKEVKPGNTNLGYFMNRCYCSQYFSGSMTFHKKKYHGYVPTTRTSTQSAVDAEGDKEN